MPSPTPGEAPKREATAAELASGGGPSRAVSSPTLGSQRPMSGSHLLQRSRSEVVLLADADSAGCTPKLNWMCGVTPVAAPDLWREGSTWGPSSEPRLLLPTRSPVRRGRTTVEAGQAYCRRPGSISTGAASNP